MLGTPSVVASLWKVDDSSTAQLMAEFYRNLKTMTKVEALATSATAIDSGSRPQRLVCQARSGWNKKTYELLEGVESPSDGSASPFVSTSLPYFWAPFILVGDGK